MRAIDQDQQRAIWGEIQSGFDGMRQLPATIILSTGTITGEQEGYYGLVSVNYLSETISLQMKPRTAALRGMADLGGTSAVCT